MKKSRNGGAERSRKPDHIFAVDPVWQVERVRMKGSAAEGRHSTEEYLKSAGFTNVNVDEDDPNYLTGEGAKGKKFVIVCEPSSVPDRRNVKLYRIEKNTEQEPVWSQIVEGSIFMLFPPSTSDEESSDEHPREEKTKTITFQGDNLQSWDIICVRASPQTRELCGVLARYGATLGRPPMPRPPNHGTSLSSNVDTDDPSLESCPSINGLNRSV